MPQQFADKQPTGFVNRIQNVAIVGAGGNVGGAITEALLKSGKQNVTALTRPESTSKLPAGLAAIKKVSPLDHAGLVEALTGQEFLILTISVQARPEEDIQRKYIDAAIEAGVPYIMPNEYASDYSRHKSLAKDTFLGDGALAVRKHIEDAGKGRTAWIALTCGFWYDYSLAGTEARFGFDFPQRTLTRFSGGTQRICVSTFPQCGRAVAALLALPLLPPSSAPQTPSVALWRNRQLQVKSFVVSQNDMLAAVLRVTGTREADWTITAEDERERYARGVKMLQEGNMLGFGIALYTRVLWSTGEGDFSDKLDNEVLGLPQESLDEWTKVAVDRETVGF